MLVCVEISSTNVWLFAEAEYESTVCPRLGNVPASPVATLTRTMFASPCSPATTKIALLSADQIGPADRPPRGAP